MSFAQQRHPTKRQPKCKVNFDFIPTALTKKTRRLLENYHNVHSYTSLPDFLWDAETQAFIEMHDDLDAIFQKASRTRSAKKSNEYYLFVASIVLSMEMLANNFASWGARFPDARLEALDIVAQSTPLGTRLMDHYLSPSSYIPTNVLNSMSPD
jgi:hypothetical protein